MRYLAQLARETTARILPRTTPAWFPTIPLIEENSATEWHDEAPRHTSAPLRGEAPPSVITDRLPSALHAAEEVNRKPVADASRSADAQEPLMPVIVERIRDTGLPVAPTPRAAQETSAQTSRPIIATEDRAQQPTIPAPALKRERTTEPITSAEKGGKAHMTEVTPPREPALTLPMILAEMTRRQEAMEARHREEDARRSLSRTTAHLPQTIAPQTSQQEPETVRLNIGSIVVQLEPALPAPPLLPPAARPRQSPREFVSRRLARSYADR